MISEFEDKLFEYMKQELLEMKAKIMENFDENMENRKHNVFCSFEDKKIVKYMMLGRSLDSQLGTRLQHIAAFLAREKYGTEYVPNLIVLTYDSAGEELVVKTVSFPLEKGTQQKIQWAESLVKADSVILEGRKTYKKNNPEMFKEYRFKMDDVSAENVRLKVKPSKGKASYRIADLLYIFGEDKNVISCFEVKAGGNLDTKNTDANKKEVEEFEELFEFFDRVESYFATCYNNMGEGNEPQGDIFRKIPRNKQLRGSEFWGKILPEDYDFEKFVALYKKAFEDTGLEKEIKEKIGNVVSE